MATAVELSGSHAPIVSLLVSNGPVMMIVIIIIIIVIVVHADVQSQQ